MTDKPPKTKPGFTTVAAAPLDGGHGVLLDGKTLRTPAGTTLVVPNAALAEAIAAEWRLAGPRPKPEAIPLTRIAGTALDRMTAQRATIETQLLDHAETELLCHRAEHPPELIARENAAWQPLLDWLALRHDALLRVTAGIVAQQQDPASLAALRNVLAGFDIWRLAVLSVTVAVSGSLVIGLALLDGRLDAAGAFDAAEVDTTFQMEKWGEDTEAMARRAAVRAELDLAARFLALLEK